jgi:DNA-binding CsgD family transcriptional regulator
LLAPFLPALCFAARWWWIDAAGEHLDQHRDSLDGSVVGRVEVGLAVRAAFDGHPTALETLKRVSEEARARHDVALEVWATFWLGVASNTSGRTRVARSCAEWVRRHAGDDPAITFLIDCQELLLDAFECNVDAAVARAHALLDQPMRTTTLVQAGCLIAPWAPAQILGQLEACVARHVLSAFDRPAAVYVEYLVVANERDFEVMYEVGLRLAEAYRFDVMVAWAHAVLAILALGTRNATLAREHLERTREISFRNEIPIVEVAEKLASAMLARDDGDNSRARRDAYTALSIASEHGNTLLAVFALEVILVLEHEEGHGSEAGRLFGALRAVRPSGGFVWHQSLIEREIEAIRPDLDPVAVAEGSRMALDEVIERVQRSRQPRNRPSIGWESLTPAELRVVELVALGQSNATIAETLFIGVATVKTHLVHVYRKLGISSRSALVAEAVARAPSRS